MEGSDIRDVRGTVLVVDDAPENIRVLSEALGRSYRIKAATDGRRALSIVHQDPTLDLVLLDVGMPELDGYTVCEKLKEDPQTMAIPVIFLTSRSDPADEQHGFDLGAVDYVTKPISIPLLQARVKSHVALKRAHDELRNRNQTLEAAVEERIREIRLVQDVAFVALGSLAETRDNETGQHIHRTRIYIELLCRALARSERYRDTLDLQTVETICKSAPLHDIGKVGIPDRILLKPGPLTADEFEVMKSHTTLGRDAIVAAEKINRSPRSFLRIAREIAWTHHEKWDGSGYPRGLRHEDIPLSGRLMALADVYDALISTRVYKAAMDHESAMQIIGNDLGKHFDPEIGNAFIRISPQIRKIASRFSDKIPE